MLTTHRTKAFQCTLHSLRSGTGQREREGDPYCSSLFIPYCKQPVVFFVKHRIVSQNTFLLFAACCSSIANSITNSFRHPFQVIVCLCQNPPQHAFVLGCWCSHGNASQWPHWCEWSWSLWCWAFPSRIWHCFESVDSGSAKGHFGLIHAGAIMVFEPNCYVIANGIHVDTADIMLYKMH